MTSLTRRKKYFLYTAPFAALVFFKIWASQDPEPESLLGVAVSMFTCSILIIGLAARWDRPGYFEWAAAVYFGLASVSLYLWPETAGSLFSRFGVTGIFACIFAAALLPPLVGMEPFTCHYAKKSTPEENWDNPVFLKINRIMTFVWAGVFGFCTLVSLYPSVITRVVIPLSIILGCGLPFNLRFPDFYLKKLGLPTLAQQRKQARDAPNPASEIDSTALPVDAWSAIAGMPDRFDARAAKGVDALIRFIVTGSESFDAFLRIREGTCTLERSPSKDPDLVVTTPASVWLAVARGERDGAEAFAHGEYTAEGDLGLLMNLGRWFRR